MYRGGITHIEVILSFLLFIFAILAGLALLNPFERSSSLNSGAPTQALGEITQENSEGLVEYHVLVNPPLEEPTLTLALNTSPSLNVRVENYSGSVLNAEQSASFLYIDWDARYGRFLIIRVGNFVFNGTAAAHPGHNASLYNITTANHESIISETRLRSLSEAYEQNYSVVRDALHLSGQNDFSLSVIFSSGERIETQRTPPVGVDVFSRTLRQKILRSNGSIEFAQIGVRIW